MEKTDYEKRLMQAAEEVYNSVRKLTAVMKDGDAQLRQLGDIIERLIEFMGILKP